MSSYHSYPKIYNIGHAAISELLSHPVIVEEKVDGSQISFGVIDGTLRVRSKGTEINLLAPEGLFKTAVEEIQKLTPYLHPEWTYRGEYLAKPKHNSLAYDRVPKRHIILFDINVGEETYLSREAKELEAQAMDMEIVPILFTGIISSVESFRALLETPSILGGQKVEGVVIKPANYALYGTDKKCLMGKFVSEAFREIHNRTWDKEHKTPGCNDIIQLLAHQFGTAARWEKACQHLKEAGKLEGSPKDIGAIMKEVPEDILLECKDAITKELFEWAWPQLRRRVTSGLPEWYKDKMLRDAFKSS